MFVAPAKKGRKRKAQREEEHSDKTLKTLTSKEVCVFDLKYNPGIESRGKIQFLRHTLSKTNSLKLDSRNPSPK